MHQSTRPKLVLSLSHELVNISPLKLQTNNPIAQKTRQTSLKDCKLPQIIRQAQNTFRYCSLKSVLTSKGFLCVCAAIYYIFIKKYISNKTENDYIMNSIVSFFYFIFFIFYFFHVKIRHTNNYYMVKNYF